MSVSALTAALTSPPAAKTLSQAANGEYTAASVADDPADALKLALVKQKDGNYAAGQPKADAPAPPAAKSSSATVAALATLTLGG